ncbi:hypothetical protein DSO57_1029885, partial [Entomophthora muscae]
MSKLVVSTLSGVDCKVTPLFGLGLDNLSLSNKETPPPPKNPAKLLHYVGDLAHSVDKRFVLAYPADSPAFAAPLWEEIII